MSSTTVTGAAGFSNGSILCVGPDGEAFTQQNVTVQVGQTANVTFGTINATQVPGPYYLFAGYLHGNGTWFQRLQCLGPANATNGNGLENSATSSPVHPIIASTSFNYTFNEVTTSGVSGQIGQPGDSVVFTAQPVNWSNMSGIPYFVSDNYTIQAATGGVRTSAEMPCFGLLALVWILSSWVFG